MDIFSFLFNHKKQSASTAKERLQIIIARERHINDGPDFMPALHRELIEVISKYVKVNPEDIRISLDKKGNLEVLDVNVILPDGGN
jgi:cell division topological specificity factor